MDYNNKTSHYKFIPKVYKNGSVKQRIEILQGLMDTDGTADSRGHISYSSVSKILANDVKELVWGLGGKATLTKKVRKSGSGYNIQIKSNFRVNHWINDN